MKQETSSNFEGSSNYSTPIAIVIVGWNTYIVTADVINVKNVTFTTCVLAGQFRTACTEKSVGLSQQHSLSIESLWLLVQDLIVNVYNLFSHSCKRKICLHVVAGGFSMFQSSLKIHA